MTANKSRVIMKKQTPSSGGNKGRNINSLKSQAPDRHDDPQRRQPPTPQDIARVQPVSQNPNKQHSGRPEDVKGGNKRNK